jgi:hypothetical protein
VSCWGSNYYGELADGRKVFAETPQTVLQGETIFANGFEN